MQKKQLQKQVLQQVGLWLGAVEVAAQAAEMHQREACLVEPDNYQLPYLETFTQVDFRRKKWQEALVVTQGVFFRNLLII